MRWVGCLCFALLTTVGLSAPSALAQRFPPDPVERLRDALRQDREPMGNKAALDYRKELLTTRGRAVRTLGDLSRALLLQDWGTEGRDLDIALVDREVYDELANRFEKGAAAALEQGEPAVRRATAALLAETSINARTSGPRTVSVQTLITRLTPALVRATQAPDPEVRAAAARALGLISPDPEPAVAALDRILERDVPVVRRAAAEALLNLELVGFESERKGRSEKRPEELRKELRETGSRVVAAAGRVLARPDPDPVVRRLAAEAMQATAFGLCEVVVVPITLAFPPESRKPWSADEKRRAKEYADEVEQELAELNPLLEALVSNIRPLSGTLRDSDVTVRLAAARAIEDVAAARDKVQTRRRSVPVVPGDNQNEANDNNPGFGVRQPTSTEPVLPVALRLRQNQSLEERAQANLAVTIQDLAAATRDRDVRVRLAAVEALELFGREARPAGRALADALQDRDPFVRWAAARTLGRLAPIVPEAALPRLVAMLKDPDLDLRIAAASTLGYFGPEGGPAEPALTASVNRGDTEIRVAALQALSGIGLASAPAIPEALKALDHNDSRVRRAAAVFLGAFGRVDPHDKAATDAVESARSTIPKLRNLLKDSDPEVRTAASEAILNLLPLPQP